MLQAAGLKVAMKNATSALKEMADFITTEDNNAGGVGSFLDELYKQLEDRVTKENRTKKLEDIDDEQSL